MHPYIGILDPLDTLSAAMAIRKECEGVAGNLIEERIVVPA